MLKKVLSCWFCRPNILHNCTSCDVSLPQSLNTKENGKKVMQIFRSGMCNITAWRNSRLRAHWSIGLVWGWGRSMYFEFPGNCSVSYLSFVYGRSLWAELNGGENSLHWKTNMLPLFSIMTLWSLRQGNLFVLFEMNVYVSNT